MKVQENQVGLKLNETHQLLVYVDDVNLLEVVTTNNYYTIADFHTTSHSTLSLLGLLSLVFTW
jgi:hypothetical protein